MNDGRFRKSVRRSLAKVAIAALPVSVGLVALSPAAAHANHLDRYYCGDGYYYDNGYCYRARPAYFAPVSPASTATGSFDPYPIVADYLDHRYGRRYDDRRFYNDGYYNDPYYNDGYYNGSDGGGDTIIIEGPVYADF